MGAPHHPFGGIKAVLFDIDDTLFPSSEFSSRARQNAIAAMVDAGLEASPAAARRALDKIISSRGSNSGDHFNLLARHFSCPDRDRVVAAGIAAYHDTKASISPYPKAAQLLLSLRARGLLVCAASEGVAVKQWDKLIRLGLDHLFHHVFVTNTAGHGKDAAFYKMIARKLCLSPAQIVMVGDNPAKDIAPARAAGLHAIRVMAGKHKLEKASADSTIKSLSEVSSLL